MNKTTSQRPGGRKPIRTASVGAHGTEPVLDAVRPVKHSFSISGHRTSISLEQAFWDALQQAAQREGKPVAELVRQIDQQRGEAGLSGAIRVWLLSYARAGGLERRDEDETGPGNPIASMRG